MIEIIERTIYTIYEDGKYYETNQKNFNDAGYVFQCIIHKDKTKEFKLVKNPNQ